MGGLSKTSARSGCEPFSPDGYPESRRHARCFFLLQRLPLDWDRKSGLLVPVSVGCNWHALGRTALLAKRSANRGMSPLCGERNAKSARHSLDHEDRVFSDGFSNSYLCVTPVHITESRSRAQQI